MLCERCQRFDIQAFGRDPYPYRGVPLLSVIRSSNHCSFCSLLLESLQKAQKTVPIKEAIDAGRESQRWLLLQGNWVNFAATKATEQRVAGSDGLNVASIDAFTGSLDTKDPKRRNGYVKFHDAADPGEMSLFSIPNSYARVLIASPPCRHPSFYLTGYYRPNTYGQTLVVDRINRVDPNMAQRLRL